MDQPVKLLGLAEGCTVTMPTSIMNEGGLVLHRGAQFKTHPCTWHPPDGLQGMKPPNQAVRKKGLHACFSMGTSVVHATGVEVARGGSDRADPAWGRGLGYPDSFSTLLP